MALVGDKTPLLLKLNWIFLDLRAADRRKAAADVVDPVDEAFPHRRAVREGRPLGQLNGIDNLGETATNTVPPAVTAAAFRKSLRFICVTVIIHSCRPNAPDPGAVGPSQRRGTVSIDR